MTSSGDRVCHDLNDMNTGAEIKVMTLANHRARIRMSWPFRLCVAWLSQYVCKVMVGGFWIMVPLSVLSWHIFSFLWSPPHPFFFPETDKETRAWVR